jgi:hypothetical protein
MQKMSFHVGTDLQNGKNELSRRTRFAEWKKLAKNEK